MYSLLTILRVYAFEYEISLNLSITKIIIDFSIIICHMVYYVIKNNPGAFLNSGFFVEMYKTCSK